MAARAQVRQLEHEKEITMTAFDTRNCELMHLLACTREDLANARASLDLWRGRAQAAEAKWVAGGAGG